MILSSVYARPAVLVLLCCSPASAFVINGHWNATATNPSTGPLGSPITLTWSIAPDNTAISGYNPSNLVSYLDGLFPGGSGSNLQQRPWFTYLQQSFDRWSALSGVTFVYEPADDSKPLGTALGQLNTRGDIRIGGTRIDGVGGTNAQTGFINNADITVETGDTPYFGNSASSYRALRNTLTHEIGHAMGMGHSDSTTAAFLMEGISNNTFDGPQLDDIRAAQQLYGDIYEKSNGGLGNNSAATATDLGMLSPGQSKTIGANAALGTQVSASATDFVSITNHIDLDYFSFTTTVPTTLDAFLTPEGASYNERPNTSSPYTTTVASAVSDLSLDLYRVVNGVPTLLQTANSHPIGQAESLQDLALPTAGQYLARISGTTDVVQLYQLAIDLGSLTILPGDYNDNGVVDMVDYVLWRDTVGQTGSSLATDGDGDQVVDVGDYDLWRSHFGESNSGLGSAKVPEPNFVHLLCACLAAILGSTRLGRRSPDYSPNVRENS